MQKDTSKLPTLTRETGRFNASAVRAIFRVDFLLTMITKQTLKADILEQLNFEAFIHC